MDTQANFDEREWRFTPLTGASELYFEKIKKQTFNSQFQCKQPNFSAKPPAFSNDQLYHKSLIIFYY
jgi:hypothetical protein